MSGIGKTWAQAQAGSANRNQVIKFVAPFPGGVAIGGDVHGTHEMNFSRQVADRVVFIWAVETGAL